MKIEQVAIEKVIPYARNPRRGGAIAKVAASLKEFGWKQPIVVDGEMVVIAGHTRLEAARQLGLKTVPVLVRWIWIRRRSRRTASPITGSRKMPSDLWLLGNHRLLCGDATAATDVEWMLSGDRSTVWG